MTKWVPPPCPELPCANERTNASLSATLAIFEKAPPTSTPGILVLTAPTTLRNSAGADILGSKVSMWLAPPPSHNQTTEVFLVALPDALAPARARRKSERRSLLSPSPPTLRQSRRLAPSQLVPVREPQRLSTTGSFHWARAALPRTAGG